MTVINFQTAMQKAQNAGYGEPLPDGDYDVVVLDAQPTQSSTQKPMIKVKYAVESGPHAGHKLRDQFVWSEENDNALSFFFQNMGLLGLDAAFFAQNPTWEQVAASLIGRRVRVALGTRIWQGAPRNEVKAYKSVLGAGQLPSTATPPQFAQSTTPMPVTPMAPTLAPVPQPQPQPQPQPVPQPMPPQPTPDPMPTPLQPIAPAPVAPAPVAPAPVAPPAPAPVPQPATVVAPPLAPPPVPPVAQPGTYPAPEVAQQAPAAPLAPVPPQPAQVAPVPQIPQVPQVTPEDPAI